MANQADWRRLSLATVYARRMRAAASVNPVLRAAADDATLRALSPALLFWSAENLLLAAQFPAAAAACRELRTRHGGNCVCSSNVGPIGPIS